MFADLHLHTTFSDGTYSPEELTAAAQRCRLATVALTDHDTVEGCPRMANACRSAGIEFIAGAELTSELNGQELHLLGYFIDIANPPLLSAIARFQQVRQDRVREIVQRLNRLKIPLAAEQVFAMANCNSPGRPHVGRALVAAGHCSSMDEAFDRFLKKHRPAWVPKFKISAAEAIRLVHTAGGVAVLAHPGLNRCDDLIPELAEAGLDGLECYHSKHPGGAAEHYARMARSLGLAITGGSDCHGMNKGQPLIGSIKLPCAYVQALKERRHARSQPLPVSSAQRPPAAA